MRARLGEHVTRHAHLLRNGRAARGTSQPGAILIRREDRRTRAGCDALPQISTTSCIELRRRYVAIVLVQYALAQA